MGINIIDVEDVARSYSGSKKGRVGERSFRNKNITVHDYIKLIAEMQRKTAVSQIIVKLALAVGHLFELALHNKKTSGCHGQRSKDRQMTEWYDCQAVNEPAASNIYWYNH